MKRNLIFLSLLFLGCCSYFKKHQSTDKDVIARVDEEYLYASDISALTKGLKGEDSLNVLKSYADTWVRQKLLLRKAKENIAEDDLAITRKVEEYRETLLLYEYEKALINQKLDTVVKQGELNEWYQKLKHDFPLKADAFLLSFIKLPKNSPELDKARRLILKPKGEEDIQKLEGYCREFATSYSIGNGMWYEKENIIKNFPIDEYSINAAVAATNFRELKTDEGLLFVRISEVLKKDEPSPLEFIRDKVMKAIIEKRRLQLIEKIYDKILADGMQSKSAEILVK